MQKILALLILILAGKVYAADVPAGPNLGRSATVAELDAMSINVFPDGRGLPDGQGNVSEGAALYQAQCLACHGTNGLGSSAEPLAGAKMELTDEWPEKTIGTLWPYATTLFDFIRRSMPMTSPGSLSNNDSYALTAYLLFLNGIITEDTTLDKHSLPKIKMPNAEGFIQVYKPEE